MKTNTEMVIHMRAEFTQEKYFSSGCIDYTKKQIPLIISLLTSAKC